MAPTARTTVPGTSVGTSLLVRWAVTDAGGSGAGTVDVRARSAAVGAGFGAPASPPSWLGLGGTSLNALVRPGSQYCLSTRARDTAGNVGAWGPESCTSIVLDDRSLAADAAWTRGTSSAAAYGTTSAAARSGARLTLPRVHARRVGVVVSTCPTCGTLDVLLDGARIGTVPLAAPSAAQQVRWLPALSRARYGTLELRSTSARRVAVDGVVLQH